MTPKRFPTSSNSHNRKKFQKERMHVHVGRWLSMLKIIPNVAALSRDNLVVVFFLYFARRHLHCSSSSSLKTPKMKFINSFHLVYRVREVFSVQPLTFDSFYEIQDDLLSNCAFSRVFFFSLPPFAWDTFNDDGCQACYFMSVDFEKRFGK